MNDLPELPSAREQEAVPGDGNLPDGGPDPVPEPEIEDHLDSPSTPAYPEGSMNGSGEDPGEEKLLRSNLIFDPHPFDGNTPTPILINSEPSSDELE